LPVASGVVSAGLTVKRVAVDFDDKARFPREKVDYEVAENDLTPERDAEPPAANGAEEKRLRRSRIEAHEVSALLKKGDARRGKGETMRHGEVLSPGDAPGADFPAQEA